MPEFGAHPPALFRRRERVPGRRRRRRDRRSGFQRPVFFSASATSLRHIGLVMLGQHLLGSEEVAIRARWLPKVTTPWPSRNRSGQDAAHTSTSMLPRARRVTRKVRSRACRSRSHALQAAGLDQARPCEMCCPGPGALPCRSRTAQERTPAWSRKAVSVSAAALPRQTPHTSSTTSPTALAGHHLGRLWDRSPQADGGRVPRRATRRRWKIQPASTSCQPIGTRRGTEDGSIRRPKLPAACARAGARGCAAPSPRPAVRAVTMAAKPSEKPMAADQQWPEHADIHGRTAPVKRNGRRLVQRVPPVHRELDDRQD